MKRCSKCKQTKPLSEFYKDKSRKDGYSWACKECIKARSKCWREVNPEKHKANNKAYYRENKELIKARTKAWYKENKDKVPARAKAYRKKNIKTLKVKRKAYYHANREEAIIKSNTWAKNNRDKVNATQRVWKRKNREKLKARHNHRMKTDIQYKLIYNIRKRVNRAINGDYKAGSVVRDLGCSKEYLEKYLESKFTEGMTWDNYGEWHIDHIKPLCSFDLTKREEFLEAVHYTNLQPLWEGDNLRKGGRCEVPTVQNGTGVQ